MIHLDARHPKSSAELLALAKLVFAYLPPPVAMPDPADTPESPLDMPTTSARQEILGRNVRVLIIRSF